MDFLVSTVFAQSQPASGQASGAQGFLASIFPLLIIVVIFYFMLIRPQQKQQKKHKEMLSALKKGDRVLTSGGIYGTVVGISDAENIVVLRISDEVKIEVAKGYVVSLKGSEDVQSKP